MELLLSLSIAIFAGLMLSRLAKLLSLPAVTAYLVAGILIGPFVLGRLQVPGLGFSSLQVVPQLEYLRCTKVNGNLFKALYLSYVQYS